MGTKLEGAYKKRKGVLEQSNHKITFTSRYEAGHDTLKET